MSIRSDRHGTGRPVNSVAMAETEEQIEAGLEGSVTVEVEPLEDEAPVRSGLDEDTMRRREEALAQVVQYGDPVLKSRASDVTEFDDALAGEIERMIRQVKGDKKLQPVLDLALELKAMLETGKPVSAFPDRESDAYRQLNSELRFLTGKTVIFAANVDEEHLVDDNEYVQIVREVAAAHNGEVVKLCAKLEEEMAGLSDEERAEFLESLGVEESGLDQVVRKGFDALGLINYFTAGPKEVRAWTIRKGSKAPQAAGVIHTDFERGFIRAEVIPYQAYAELGTETAVKAAGLMRVEGKEYVVQDGDSMHFRFNV